MKKIGFLKTFTSREIEKSFISIDFGCLDRELFNPDKCYDSLFKTGVKFARCQTGWNRCEKQKGVFTFEWLDFDRLDTLNFVPRFLKKDIYHLPEQFTIRTETD